MTTFPCYVRVLDAFKAEKKEQISLKKGEYIRVLRCDETDDNYFGEVFGKSGYFPNYYVEVVTENDIPKKDRDLFKKLDKSKEQQRGKEEKGLKAPAPRKDRTSIAFPSSPRKQDKDDDSGSNAASPRASSPRSGFGSKKNSEPRIRASGRRKSGEIKREDIDALEISVDKVVLPEKKQEPVSAVHRKLSKQPRRLSRVNPKDVKRLYEGPTFGVPLAHQMYIGYEEFVIPPILQKTTHFLLDHLELEGLFRVSGSQDEIAVWKEQFNAGKPVEFSGKMAPHSVAGLLKAWLRELPEPLLTFLMFDAWMEIATKGLSKGNKACEEIKTSLKALPDINYAVLRELFLFLRKVVDNSAKNLMTAENVGVVIGPNILSKENQDAITSATVMPAAVNLAAFFVKNAEVLFANKD